MKPFLGAEPEDDQQAMQQLSPGLAVTMIVVTRELAARVIFHDRRIVEGRRTLLAGTGRMLSASCTTNRRPPGFGLTVPLLRTSQRMNAGAKQTTRHGSSRAGHDMPPDGAGLGRRDIRHSDARG